MDRHAVTHAVLTPSVLASLDPAGRGSLRCLVAAGEACAPELVARWAPGRAMFNAYGPTEVTVMSNLGAVAAVGFYICTPTKGSNVIEIIPLSLVPRGGLVVSLDGSPKPLAFLLVGGGGRYDASLSVHVADRGPRARVEIMTQPGAPETGAPYLTGMLQGVPPADAVPLSVEGVSPEGLRAWRLGRAVYLRTRYTLLSPEWTASESEGGLTVYAVPNTPIVLLSVGGRTVSARLKE